MLGIINPKQFQNLFIRRIESVLEIPEGTYLSIDGKTLKRSGNEQAVPLYLLSAYSHGPGVVLGQMNCGEKSNEISACPQLLDSLKISGAVITTGAMMCRKTIAQKNSRKEMRLRAGAEFECRRATSTEQTGTMDTGHGRLEHRKYTPDTDVNWFAERREWKNLKAFGTCESSRTVRGKQKSQTRYFVTGVTDVIVFARELY